VKRLLLIALLLLAGAGIYFGSKLYFNLLVANTPLSLEKNILLIPTGAPLEEVIDSLTQNKYILNENTFRWAAERMDYDDQTIRPGRYTIPVATSNKNLIAILRGGRQTPLNVTIQNVRTIEQMAGRISSRLEFDSATLMRYLSGPFDSIAGTTPPTRLTRFLPNTYEFYWTVSPEEFGARMLKEYESFWTEERKAKAQQIGLTQDEVYTLASIIEKETNHNPEKPRMAGVYLNRIRDGIPLQADPTIVFAIGDFSIRRILYGHLEVDSPYNTYKNAGLPPGPIFMPGLPSINAVLDREVHDYIYFCARPSEDGPGHAFAVTLREHNQNAQRYQRWLDKQGIY
jgi:UPF0755 protein